MVVVDCTEGPDPRERDGEGRAACAGAGLLPLSSARRKASPEIIGSGVAWCVGVAKPVDAVLALVALVVVGGVTFFALEMT